MIVETEEEYQEDEDDIMAINKSTEEIDDLEARVNKLKSILEEKEKERDQVKNMLECVSRSREQSKHYSQVSETATQTTFREYFSEEKNSLVLGKKGSFPKIRGLKSVISTTDCNSSSYSSSLLFQ